jgi:hypothetical protein
MATPAVAGEAELRHQLARRRVFVFFFAFTLVALLPTMLGESDQLTHIADDVILVALAIIALAIIGAWWRRDTVAGLQQTHNAVLTLLIIALIVQIGAIYIERNDPSDFGNEIPSLFFILAMIINRIV